MDKENQCLKYFHGNPVWEKVFRGFWHKYYSYGRFSGTVKLNHLTMPEIEELEGFFWEELSWTEKCVRIFGEIL